MSGKYGNLPALLEEIELRVGKTTVQTAFRNTWAGLHEHGEVWLDSMKSAEEIDKCGQFRAIVKEGMERGYSGMLSTSCVWIISAWEAMGEPRAVEMMKRYLIDLEKEPISALALVGEYMT